MKAETAYNVIQALPKEELPRLYKLLGLSPAKETQTKKVITKVKPISDAVAKEFLRAKVFRTKKYNS